MFDCRRVRTAGISAAAVGERISVMLQSILEWLGDTKNSNLIRAIVALMAIPSAVWGAYLFARFISGKGMTQQLDAMAKQNEELLTQNRELNGAVQQLLDRLDRTAIAGQEVDYRLARLLESMRPDQELQIRELQNVREFMQGDISQARRSYSEAMRIYRELAK
jgi:uncharacterized protein YoxC